MTLPDIALVVSIISVCISVASYLIARKRYP